ncbi:MAG: hypothetical protein U0414_33275 [Polyangiaceae bacterium]
MKTRRPSATKPRSQVASSDVAQAEPSELAARMRRAALLFKWPELLSADVRLALDAPVRTDVDWLAAVA